jgi:hypothetical protein
MIDSKPSKLALLNFREIKERSVMKENTDELVHCFIAFFDIRGFGRFERRVTDPKTELHPWRKEWRKIIDDFRKRTGYTVKRAGDGGAVFFEALPSDAGILVVEFLDNCWDLLMQFKALRRKKESPRYDGDRIGVSYGALWKEPCTQLGKDYYGYMANLTEKTIHQHKEVCFRVTEKCKELMTQYQRQKAGYRFKRMEIDHKVPCDPIYQADMELLWGFQKRKVGN